MTTGLEVEVGIWNKLGPRPSSTRVAHDCGSRDGQVYDIQPPTAFVTRLDPGVVLADSDRFTRYVAPDLGDLIS